jgi:hypothetical protein
MSEKKITAEPQRTLREEEICKIELFFTFVLSASSAVNPSSFENKPCRR